MDWQLCLTELIILTALIITGWRLVKFFAGSLHHCEACSSADQGCALKDLKKEIQAGKKEKGCKIHDRD